MKREFHLLLLFVGIVLPLRPDDATTPWSSVQGGLQARLVCSRANNHAFALGIEFRNVLENNLGVGLGLKFRYYRNDLSVSLADAAGHSTRIRLDPAPDAGGIVRGQTIDLAPLESGSLPIGSARIATPHPVAGGKFAFNDHRDFVILPDTGPYRLWATFTKPAATGDDSSLENLSATSLEAISGPAGWHGTLELPAISIPSY